MKWSRPSELSLIPTEATGTPRSEIYCRVVLLTFRSYFRQACPGYGFVLSCAMIYITAAASDLSTLNELTNPDDSDVLRRLDVVIQFIKEAVTILDQEGVPEHVCICVRAGYDSPRAIFCDRIANMIYTVISLASEVRLPQLEWKIQHNSVWSNLFHYGAFKRPAGQVVTFKLRRLLYNQIADMQRFPNVERSKILRFCLNVLALAVIRGTTTRATEDFITEYFTRPYWPGRKSTSSGYIATTHALLRAAWETTSPTTQSTYAWPTPILPRGR